MKRSPLKRTATLSRSPLARKRPLRSRVKARTPETGEAAFKLVQRGHCSICGKWGWVRRHHVLTESKVRQEGADPWALRNAIIIGVGGEGGARYTCDCHANHHAASRKIPIELVPEDALAFAVDVLGEARAADYFRRRYRCEETS